MFQIKSIDDIPARELVHFAIKRTRPLVEYFHHFIIIRSRNDFVKIHYTTVNSIFEFLKDSTAGIIKKSFLEIQELKSFIKDGLYIIDEPNYPKTDKEIEIAKERCYERLGERAYHVMYNNCEHFARWVMTGKAESCQLDEASSAKKIIGDGIDILVNDGKSNCVEALFNCAASATLLSTEADNDSITCHKKVSERASPSPFSTTVSEINTNTHLPNALTRQIDRLTDNKIKKRIFQDTRLSEDSPCNVGQHSLMSKESNSDNCRDKILSDKGDAQKDGLKNVVTSTIGKTLFNCQFPPAIPLDYNISTIGKTLFNCQLPPAIPLDYNISHCRPSASLFQPSEIVGNLRDEGKKAFSKVLKNKAFQVGATAVTLLAVNSWFAYEKIKELRKMKANETINALDYKREVAKTVVSVPGSALGSTAGAVIGQALFPIPIIGAALGGFAGNVVGKWASSALVGLFW